MLVRCTSSEKAVPEKIRIIFDTDTNNELDDQHALAYLLFNQETFKIEGITVNATRSGGNIDKQYDEAKRILQLCAADTLPVFKGADKNFLEILPMIGSSDYDGNAAVDFILSKSKENPSDTLTIVAVGKLTTIALAVAKDPTLSSRVRLVWLGSHYPEPGEYNLDSDTVPANYLLKTKIPFEMVTVRWGKTTGTAAVNITQAEINRVMPGLGPHINNPVTGRHGGEFYCFGDYSVDLFKHIDYHSDPPTRSLFDLAAVAIVKNPSWGQTYEVSAPLLINNQWIERAGNPRKVTIWENFNREAIIGDFLSTMPKEEKQ
jgi:hypothetical protein